MTLHAEFERPDMFQLSGPPLSAIVSLSEFLESTSDPWWILGSAAIALSGVDPDGVRDVDVLVSERDARQLMETKNLRNEADGGGEAYRSEIFLLPDLGAVTVEVMANYAIRQGNTWRPVSLHTRQPVSVGGATVYVPGPSEQMELLQRLGRPKDLQRLKRLRDQNQP